MVPHGRRRRRTRLEDGSRCGFQDVEGVDTPSLRRCGKVLPLIIT